MDKKCRELEDFEILKNVVTGKIAIKDLDIEVEKRLITLCNNRLKSLNERITVENMKIDRLEKLVNNLNTTML